MNIIINGGDWKRNIEMGAAEIKTLGARYLFIEAATRAIELEYKENDEFEVGIVLTAYHEKDASNIENHIMLSSYMALVNAGLYSIAESMRQFFKDSEDIDIACQPEAPATKKKKKKKS